MRTLLSIALLAATLTALILLQNQVLDKTGEQRREASHTQLTDLPAKEMVPTYIGSLFLGSFRALAIDIFWIQLKEAQKERRWYQAREIMEMISRLQPHNEEVWSMLAWDSAYNIANSEEQISYDRAWKWVQYGILKLREGVRVNPRSPYLAFELARILQHKPTWQSGTLDRKFLSRIEKDGEIQEALQFPEQEGTKTAFELSILWFKETIRRLRIYSKEEALLFRTQMGLYLHEDTMEAFLRDALYYQAVYRWTQAREEGPDSPAWKEANLWLEKAGKQTRTLNPELIGSSMLEEQASFYEGLQSVFKASQAFHRNRNGETLRRYVSGMEKLMVRFGPIDGGFVRRILSEFRQRLSLEDFGPRRGTFVDENEFNDTHPFATHLEPGNPLFGNLLPGYDADSFIIPVSAPGRPVVRVLRIGDTNLEIRISLGNQAPILTRIISSNTPEELPFEASTPGYYHIDIRPSPPQTSDTRYRIEISEIPLPEEQGPNPDHEGHDH